MEAPSSTLNRNSRSLRPKRRGPELRLMESHRTTRHYDYESLLRASRQAPTDTTTSPSSIVDVGSHEARKYRDLSDPRKHKSPALSLRPPPIISRLPRRNPLPTYPYDALPVTLWPSRDPIEEWGGANLYGMVDNNSISRIDFLGLDGFQPPTPYKLSPEAEKILGEMLEEEFQEWKDENDDLSWLKDLPDCPCKIDKYTYMTFGFQRRTGYSVRSWDDYCPLEEEGVWSSPSDLLFGYHEGASVCIRSNKLGKNGKSGQQCCYDKDGDLITHGVGAGTPDKTSTSVNNFGPGGHQEQDVRPFDVAMLLDGSDYPGINTEEYLKRRPPNNGKKCDKNPK